MDGVRFDRFARNFARRVSRRNAIIAAGVLAFGSARGASANQLTPPTCGASGDVCTLLMGCCEGLTCVTSAINTNYGVCVAGEGGTVSIGTTLISPFSENVEQEVAAIAASETSSTTTTTDPQAEREQHLAEVKARKDARRTEQKSRRTTKQNEQQDRRDDRQFNRELRRGPQLRLVLSQPGTVDETLRVTNQDDDSVVISEIASYLFPASNFLFSPPYPVGTGDSLLFLSGGTISGTVEGNKLRWISRVVCETEGDGFVVTAGFSSSSENHEFTILCDGTVPGAGGGNGKPRRKKRDRNGGKNKN